MRRLWPSDDHARADSDTALGAAPNPGRSDAGAGFDLRLVPIILLICQCHGLADCRYDEHRE